MDYMGKIAGKRDGTGPNKRSPRKIGRKQVAGEPCPKKK